MQTQTRIRRASSYGAAQSTPVVVPGAMSSSYQPTRLGRGLDLGDLGGGGGFTPTYDRELRFDERDDENDDDDEAAEATTEDESEGGGNQQQAEREARPAAKSARRKSIGDELAAELSRAQKQGCFTYIQRRHSIALAFASTAAALQADGEAASNWTFHKSKHGVALFKSKRSRCEVRAVTRVNSSVKNVMSLLAVGDSSASFAHAQKVLLGAEHVLEARVLAQCVPASASRYFHCGLKHLALKNPFGVAPLDLVFLDYTDVAPTPDGKLVGYRIMESIRVPEYGAVPKYVRASLRCEVYVVRETDVPGVVEVTFASHLDPKSKFSAAKRSHWLERAAARLLNLRGYAEQASFAHKLILEKGKWIERAARQRCFVCDAGFSLLRKRHNCRLCGEVTCGRCSRKLPILVDAGTARVRTCLRCILASRHDPDELGRSQFGSNNNGNGADSRRGSLSNATYIAYDELDQAEQLERRQQR